MLDELKQIYDTGYCLHCGADLSSCERRGNTKYLCAKCKRDMDIRCSQDMERYLLIHRISTARLHKQEG